MKNLKIRVKLLMIAVFAIICLFVVGVGGILFMGTMDGCIDGIVDECIPLLTAAEELNNDTSNYRRNELRHIIATDDSSMQSTENTMDELSDEINEKFSECLSLITVQERRELLQNAQSAWNTYISYHDSMIEASRAGNQQEAMVLSDDTKDEFDAATQAFSAFVSSVEEKVDEYSAEARSAYSIALTTMIILVLIATVILVVISLLVISMVTKPVSELDNVSRKIANGDLDAVIRYESKDELGTLAKNFNLTVTKLRNYVNYINEISAVLDQMASGDLVIKLTYDYVGEFAKIKTALQNISSSLSETITHINDASEQVASGSDQVATGAQALSQGATEQASSVEELAATINEISANINKNAEHAQNASDQATATAAELEHGKQQMTSMTEAMGQINSSANEISKIIKTIEDIAFQTNILALNAAVEAARAGAAGKGFAVVADEVRNLASKSAEASANTASLIEATIKAVNEGTTIADATAASFDKILQMSEESAEIIHEISKASSDQASAVSQVTIGIDQISSVVQTNSATAEESAAASEELSGQAQVLKGLVGKFKLQHGMSYSAPVPTYNAPSYSAPSLPSYDAPIGGDKY